MKFCQIQQSKNCNRKDKQKGSKANPPLGPCTFQNRYQKHRKHGFLFVQAILSDKTTVRSDLLVQESLPGQHCVTSNRLQTLLYQSHVRYKLPLFPNTEQPPSALHHIPSAGILLFHRNTLLRFLLCTVGTNGYKKYP